MLYLSNEANKEHNAGTMIQTFFPFDPYLLKKYVFIAIVFKLNFKCYMLKYNIN